MTIAEKIVQELERLRSARHVEILTIKVSMKASDEISVDEGKYDIKVGKKYVEKFSGIDVYIDPYRTDVWVQVYYRTPASSLNSTTITGDTR